VPSGSQFGSYEILSLLGVGGMGQVYRARDTRLDRIVALKVLSHELTSDVDRIERFAREARILAALNHPNIGAIYSIEDADGRRGLIMELVDGETLEERLARQRPGHPLPLAETIEIARQIADALDAAHEKGIVHRDLKPANVMITRDGVVKVLDFGLAKIHPAVASSAETHDRLKTAPTEHGTVLGTAPYMSPEQARGVAVDKRTDIWAFGCVLYELLTGKRAFGGETGSDVLAAILERTPDFDTLPAATPPTVKRLLQRCLERDPKRRMRDIGDARVELDDVRSNSVPAASGGTRSTRWLWGGAVAAALCLALGGFGVWAMLGRPEPAAPARITRLSIQTPAQAPLASSPTYVASPGNAALSPDGSQLVYMAALPEGGSRLYSRALDESGVRPLIGTDGASAPFFSPDGASIGFFAGGKLKRVPANGGDVTTICDVGGDDSGGSSGAWSPDGTIVFAQATATRSGLFRVSAGGGVPEALTHPDSAEGGSHGDPSMIDERAVLFVTRFVNPNAQPSLRVLLLATGEVRTLVEGSADRPLYVPTGHLLFVRARQLMASPFDATRLQPTGAPIPVLENVGIGALSISRDGVLAYNVPGASTGRLVWVSRDGAVRPILTDQLEFGRPRLSPDDRRLLTEVYQGRTSDVYSYGFENNIWSLTASAANTTFWSPDARFIGFRQQSGAGVFSLPADGSAEPWPLVTPSDLGVENPGFLAPGGWTPDGSAYVFVRQGSSATAADIWVLRVGNGPRRIEPLVERPRNQWSVRVSPDGRWMSYASDESGQYEVYVQTLERGGPRWQISTRGGWQALWKRSGGEIFYRAGDRMMTVAVTTTPSFKAEAPRELFRGVFASTDVANYDVTADGQRFIMVQPYDEAEERTIQVIDHWLEELKRLVPVGETP